MPEAVSADGEGTTAPSRCSPRRERRGVLRTKPVDAVVVEACAPEAAASLQRSLGLAR